MFVRERGRQRSHERSNRRWYDQEANEPEVGWLPYGHLAATTKRPTSPLYPEAHVILESAETVQ